VGSTILLVIVLALLNDDVVTCRFGVRASRRFCAIFESGSSSVVEVSRVEPTLYRDSREEERRENH
jgi:hypothetical protein